MACEQGNLFGPPEEHQIIFCPNSFFPFAKIHSPHLISILYASLHRHYAIVTFFTQLSSLRISLRPTSYAFFPLPVPTAYSLTLPLVQSWFNESYSLLQFCSPFSFSLASSSATPKIKQMSPILPLPETYSPFPAFPSNFCLFCIQIKQAPALHFLGLQEIFNCIKEVT